MKAGGERAPSAAMSVLSLYELEVEAEIPAELYEAMAVVLRWAFQVGESEREGRRR